MTPEKLEAVRREFEAWARERHLITVRLDSGDYFSLDAEHSWHAYLARAEHEEPASKAFQAAAARWKLRAHEMKKCGAGVSAQFLTECAEEVEAILDQREPGRTSWFRAEHEEREREIRNEL